MREVADRRGIAGGADYLGFSGKGGEKPKAVL